MPLFITEYPQFFTATIQDWKKLLEPDKYKDIIVDSLKFLVEDKRIKLNAFVIMSDHIHLIWQMQPLIHPDHVKRDFLKYTAQRIKADLQMNHPAVLTHFQSDTNDRYYQFWKRRALSVELRTHKVYIQKLEYIHWNPVRAGLCKLPEEYRYSSALFYETGIDNPSINSGGISYSLSGLTADQWRG
ncbi:MAG TPA: transposase, partial [Chitinophagaceae bacterium]|nr:transposase [Chitinophagaceae bacterium]